ncbi:hypothetical protein DUNSADRAFT_18110 [Dunaliella salina]|uniref:HRDC domain-containing protein n=1 Tax=Dunaliella salina TaxID=3046 RepID=A0ABQ7G0N6_DUNSA|nr:hypothetical protein DUNSADRAFT_18110 [Dunaliella salina]|eukprot:KAF5828156.1 hypothetical protein DUNSADRAFT_18110 [Dunaliella salina]
MGSLEEAIKGAQKLSEAASKTQISPHAADYHYYKSFPEFKSRVNEVQKSIQDTLLACQAAAAPKSSKGAPVVDWEDANEVREWVGCALDDCMEGVDAAIDQHRKAVKQQALAEENAPDGVGVNAGAAPQVLPSQLGPVSSIGGAPKGLLRNLQAGRSRPQEMFDLPVDNSPQPFQHWAPHLASVLPSTAVPAPGTEQASANPFAPVLGQLTYKPSHLDASTVCPPRPLEETPIAWVDTPEALNAVASELQGEQHIAVDLEHHSYRSFQGFTCLMQLSSRTKDYIVDTLALRKHIGPALIGIFANPGIVKVLHGADHDVLWLQRDFHLYLVNMFDTGQATRVLSYPSNSLAFLLEQFCGVKADKRFQLADWRARPLSPEMLDYARGDTHYLLYCYDRLKQELVNMGDQVPPSLLAQGGPQAPTPCVGGLALATVLERSRQLCLASYEKELPPTKQSCDDSVLRWELSLTSLQREVLFAAALWRDTVCRELDEGTGYVLPRSQLITLAQHMPDTAKDVLRLLGRSASEALRSRAPALAARIHAAKAESAAATAAKEAAAAAALTAASISPSAVSAPAADPGTAPAAAPAHPPVTTDAHAAGLLGTSVGMPPALAQGVSLAEPAGAYVGSMDAQQVAALSHATPGMAMTASTAPTSATAAAPAHSVSGPSTSNPAATTAPGVVLAPKPVAPIKSKASRGGGLFGGAGSAAKKQKVGPHASVAPVSKPGEVGTATAANAAHATQVLTEAEPLVAGTAAAADAATAAQGGQTLLQAAEGGQAPSQASRAAGGGQACSHAPSPAAERGQVSSQASRAAEGGQAPQQAAEGGQAPSQASQAAGLLGPTMHPSPATHEAAGTGPQNSGAAGGGPDGVGEGKLVAQLKASLALPFPVLAPPVGGEASQGNGEGHLEVSTGAGNAQQQQQQHEQQLKQHVQGEQEQGIQQQQEQQHEQHIQGEQEQGIQEGFHGGGGQHHPGGHGEVSLPFVPIPKNKDRKPGKPEGRHQQGGISQMSLPRVSKDTLKRKYISVQEGGGGKDDLDG